MRGNVKRELQKYNEEDRQHAAADRGKTGIFQKRRHGGDCPAGILANTADAAATGRLPAATGTGR